MTQNFCVYQVIMVQFTSLPLKIQRKINSQGKVLSLQGKFFSLALSMYMCFTVHIDLG